MQDGGAFGVAFDRHCSKNVTLQLNRDSHFPDLAHFDGSAARIRNLIFEASCTAASTLLGPASPWVVITNLAAWMWLSKVRPRSPKPGICPPDTQTTRATGRASRDRHRDRRAARRLASVPPASTNANRTHLVVHTIHHQRRVADALQLGKAVAGKLLPVAEGSNLGAGNLRSRDAVAVLCPQ